MGKATSKVNGVEQESNDDCDGTASAASDEVSAKCDDMEDGCSM